MSDALKQWVGQVVNGKFPLLRYLGSSGRGAVYLTERHEGERAEQAAIKLIPCVAENDEQQLARLRLAAEASHPHLQAMLEFGQCQMGEAAMLYVVTEYAEENLAEVLSGRALTPDEAREMLQPVLEALASLHARGLVHGHVKPANILADGEQLKLSSDALCRTGDTTPLLRAPDAYDPPEYSRGIIPTTGTASPAGDVWSLGVTLVEVLTQRVPTAPAAGQSEVLLPKELPEPFLDIVRHCLTRHPQGRWEVAEISARLQGRAPAQKSRPAVTPVQAPAQASRAAVRTRQSPRPRAKRGGYAVPVLVALAVVAVIAGPRLFRRAANSPEPSATPSEQSSVQQPAERQAVAAPAIAPVPALSAAPPQETANLRSAAAVPASVQPDSVRNVDASASSSLKPANAPAAALVRGEVIERVLPNVSQGAQDSIQGTVRVSVSVEVDAAGNVERAELVSPGPSKYFARAALQAAERWKFQPPTIAGRNVSSNWSLRFDFTRSGPTVVPAQTIP